MAIAKDAYARTGPNKMYESSAGIEPLTSGIRDKHARLLHRRPTFLFAVVVGLDSLAFGATLGDERGLLTISVCPDVRTNFL